MGLALPPVPATSLQAQAGPDRVCSQQPGQAWVRESVLTWEDSWTHGSAGTPARTAHRLTAQPSLCEGHHGYLQTADPLQRDEEPGADTPAQRREGLPPVTA